jgi:hypothetical protein
MSNNNSATFKIILPVSDAFFVSSVDGNQDTKDDALVVAINRQIDDGLKDGVDGGVNDGVNGGVNKATRA